MTLRAASLAQLQRMSSQQSNWSVGSDAAVEKPSLLDAFSDFQTTLDGTESSGIKRFLELKVANVANVANGTYSAVDHSSITTEDKISGWVAANPQYDGAVDLLQRFANAPLRLDELNDFPEISDDMKDKLLGPSNQSDDAVVTYQVLLRVQAGLKKQTNSAELKKLAQVAELMTQIIDKAPSANTLTGVPLQTKGMKLEDGQLVQGLEVESQHVMQTWAGDLAKCLAAKAISVDPVFSVDLSFKHSLRTAATQLRDSWSDSGEPDLITFAAKLNQDDFIFLNPEQFNVFKSLVVGFANIIGVGDGFTNFLDFLQEMADQAAGPLGALEPSPLVPGLDRKLSLGLDAGSDFDMDAAIPRSMVSFAGDLPVAASLAGDGFSPEERFADAMVGDGWDTLGRRVMGKEPALTGPGIVTRTTPGNVTRTNPLFNPVDEDEDDDDARSMSGVSVDSSNGLATAAVFNTPAEFEQIEADLAAYPDADPLKNRLKHANAQKIIEAMAKDPQYKDYGVVIGDEHVPLSDLTVSLADGTDSPSFKFQKNVKRNRASFFSRRSSKTQPEATLTFDELKTSLDSNVSFGDLPPTSPSVLFKFCEEGQVFSPERFRHAFSNGDYPALNELTYTDELGVHRLGDYEITQQDAKTNLHTYTKKGDPTKTFQASVSDIVVANGQEKWDAAVIILEQFVQQEDGIYNLDFDPPEADVLGRRGESMSTLQAAINQRMSLMFGTLPRGGSRQSPLPETPDGNDDQIDDLVEFTPQLFTATQADFNNTLTQLQAANTTLKMQESPDDLTITDFEVRSTSDFSVTFSGFSEGEHSQNITYSSIQEFYESFEVEESQPVIRGVYSEATGGYTGIEMFAAAVGDANGL